MCTYHWQSCSPIELNATAYIYRSLPTTCSNHWRHWRGSALQFAPFMIALKQWLLSGTNCNFVSLEARTHRATRLEVCGVRFSAGFGRMLIANRLSLKLRRRRLRRRRKQWRRSRCFFKVRFTRVRLCHKGNGLGKNHIEVGEAKKGVHTCQAFGQLLQWKWILNGQ